MVKGGLVGRSCSCDFDMLELSRSFVLKSSVFEQRSLTVCPLSLVVRPYFARTCWVPKLMSEGLLCPFRQPLCTARRPRTAVSGNLGMVGPDGAHLLEK